MHTRSKQSLTARSLKTIALMVLLVVSQPLFAFTFDVDSAADAVDANPGDGRCQTAGGNCTLRAAIQEANAWLGADAIRLPAGNYFITIDGANEDDAATGDLDIKDDLTITGAANNTTVIDGSNKDRVFDVVAVVNFTLKNVTVTHGSVSNSHIGAGIKSVGALVLDDDIITSNNNGDSGGGGVANEQGSLTLNYSEVRGNRASSFGGIQHNFGTLIIDHSVISNNTAGSGAGIGIFNGTATITDSSIDSNLGAATQGGQGGGIYNAGNLKVLRSTIDKNVGAQGGGIANAGTGSVTVVNSTIDENISQSGGGILNQSPGQGTNQTTPSLFVISSTINSNSANGTRDPNQQLQNGYGGGIFYTKSITLLMNSIVSNNSANTDGADCSDGSIFNDYAPGTINSQGHNLDTSNTCQLTGTGDKPNTSPLLGALANNGGPTQTLEPNTGSPAIDAGDPTGCKDESDNTLTMDQRGFPRPDSSTVCDIGAVEVQGSTGLVDLSVHVTASPAPVDPGKTITYTVTVKNNGPSSTTSSVTLTDTLPPTTSVTAPPTNCSGSSTVTCTISSLAVGAEKVFTITANVPSNVTGALTNTAVVTTSGSDSDPNNANNTETTNTDVNLTADLKVTMSDGPDPAVLNQDQVTYTMIVTSLTGSQTVPNVTLVDTLPASATLITGSTTTDRGTCTENGGAKRVTCDLGSMAAGNTATITIKVRPGVKGTMTNTANVNFDGTDPDSSNNKASQDTTVAVFADIAVTATDDRDPVGVKNDLSYIINVKNNGPSPSSDVSLTATLPSGVNFSSASASQGLGCSESSGTVTCDLQAMAKDAQATVTIFVVPQNITSIQMSATAQVASDETDPDSGNNSVTESTEVVDNPSKASADLSMSIGAGPNPVNTGDTLTYTMTVLNNGTDTATGVIAVLSLPASATVSSPGSGCSKDSQTNIVRCSLSNLGNGASAQATVGVTPTQSGIIKATASASFIGTDPDTSNNTANVSTTVNAATGGGGGGTSSGGGGGGLGPVALLTILACWAAGARLARRRGSAAK